MQPANICVAGESSGGYLSLLTVLKLKEEGVPLPAAVMLMSPDTVQTCHIHGDAETAQDATLSGESHRVNKNDSVTTEDSQWTMFLASSFGMITPHTGC